MTQLTLFDKINAVFSKRQLSKAEFGRDGFMIIRFLSMHPDYAAAMNNIQKYQAILGHRIMVLLQEMFGTAEAAPFLNYAKKEDEYKRFSDRAHKILSNLFGVSRLRLEEYMANLYVTEDEINEIWGLD